MTPKFTTARILAPLALATLTALSTSALAASQTHTGEVKSTDAAKHQLTLGNGDTFEVSNHVKLNAFKAGDKVAVTYDMKGGKMVASKIKHEK